MGKSSWSKLTPKISKSVAWFIVIVFAISAIAPAYWMIVSSLKTQQELFTSRSPLLVLRPVISQYEELFQTTPFGQWFLNSVVVAGSAMAISVIFGALAAYGINRSPSRFGVTIAQVILMTYVVPRVLFVVPFYILLNSVGLLNTQFGLSLAYLTFSLPFTIWLLLGFFDGIPRELDEAAMVDGCSRVGTLMRIILPLAGPGIVATSIYILAEAWNEFMYPLALIQTQVKTTVTVGIATMQQGDVFAWGQIMAAGTVVTIPILLFFMSIYRRIVGGMVAGGVKG